MPTRIETVASFAKGLAVIRSFGPGARRQTITEVAARTGLTRAGARRFLHTLVETGHARSDGKHFELTARVLELGDAYVRGLSELDVIRDVLEDTAREFGGCVVAATLDGADVVHLARASAPRCGTLRDRGIATRLPAHATAAGQALLADLGQNEFDRFMRGIRWDVPTSRDALQVRLAEVRARGFAVVEADVDAAGHRAIAVTIPGRPTAARLALEFAAPSGAVDAATMIEIIAPRLRAAARRIADGENAA